MIALRADESEWATTRAEARNGGTRHSSQRQQARCMRVARMGERDALRSAALLRSASAAEAHLEAVGPLLPQIPLIVL
jgi:hypothetical protein